MESKTIPQQIVRPFLRDATNRQAHWWCSGCVLLLVFQAMAATVERHAPELALLSWFFSVISQVGLLIVAGTYVHYFRAKWRNTGKQ
jgi:hypothetical protein